MPISWKKLREEANRLNGFEVPIIGGGISWQPKELDVTKARRLLVFLEDKRVLYNPFIWERTDYCIESVLNIRTYIVEQILMETEQSSNLYEYAKELRDGCVEFLEIMQSHPDPRIGKFRVLRAALGRLRRVFGLTLLKIAVTYEIDVEENLATIIPASPNYDSRLYDR